MSPLMDPMAQHRLSNQPVTAPAHFAERSAVSSRMSYPRSIHSQMSDMEPLMDLMTQQRVFKQAHDSSRPFCRNSAITSHASDDVACRCPITHSHGFNEPSRQQQVILSKGNAINKPFELNDMHSALYRLQIRKLVPMLFRMLTCLKGVDTWRQ